MRSTMLAVALLAGSLSAMAGDKAPDTALAHSVEQLRGSIGRRDVMTDFLNPDGSVAGSAAGTYEFSWIHPDRVVAGRSDMPARKQSAGILFYIREARREIEMVSVGGDGRLWIMTGPLGVEVRTSQEYATTDGGKGRLRFTRFNVTPNSFDSRMEYTEDGGKSRKPGNRQKFRRVSSGAP